MWHLRLDTHSVTMPIFFFLCDPNSTNWECLKKTEPDPSERYTAEGWKAIETIWNTRNYDFDSRKKGLSWVWWSTGVGAQGGCGISILEIFTTQLDEALRNLFLWDVIQAGASSGPFPLTPNCDSVMKPISNRGEKSNNFHIFLKDQ